MSLNNDRLRLHLRLIGYY